MADELPQIVKRDEDLLDPWPRLTDGSEWDGTNFVSLLESGENPFGNTWDPRALIHEVESRLDTKVIDVPNVSFGANHYGFHFRLSNRPDVIARLARGDMNKQCFSKAVVREEIMHDHFELSVYTTLKQLGNPFDCGPLYHRDPVLSNEEDLGTGQGITGRRLFLFEKAKGIPYEYGHWRLLSGPQKTELLCQSARVAARLFQHHLPQSFSSAWVLKRNFGSNASFALEVTPTREFCIALLEAKINVFFASSKIGMDLKSIKVRDTLLHVIPDLLPRSEAVGIGYDLYRFVIDHGDFGMQNMTIDADPEEGYFDITSVFDWEIGSIVPAVLAEPKMVTTVDMIINELGEPSISRWGDGDTPEKMSEYQQWSNQYYKTLFSLAPEYREIIKAGLDARKV